MTTWHPRLETGHSAIDQEHQRFFIHLDDLHQATERGANRSKVVELIGHLQQFALDHFEREEGYMLQLGCRSHPENYETHREFALRLEGWRFLLTTAGTPVTLASSVHREATEWIESHIADDGCKLRACRCFEFSVAG